MGIEFTGLDDETRNRLQSRIEAMAEESEAARRRPGTLVRPSLISIFPSNGESKTESSPQDGHRMKSHRLAWKGHA